MSKILKVDELAFSEVDHLREDLGLEYTYEFYNIIFLIIERNITEICKSKYMFRSNATILFLACWGLRSMMKISLLHKIGNLALTCSYIKNIKFSQRVILANICIEIASTITMQGRTYMHNYVTYLIQKLQALQY